MSAVTNGATWLDQNILDWWNYIDVDKLDMSNLTKCVLGQIGIATNVGNYYQMIDKFNLNHNEYNYGFVLEEHQNEWVQLICERQRSNQNSSREVNLAANNKKNSEALYAIETALEQQRESLKSLYTNNYEVSSAVNILTSAIGYIREATNKEVIKEFRGE